MRALISGITAFLIAGAANAQVVHSLDAEEARQGVSSDGTHAYAIDNSRIGKYDLKTGQRVAQWQGEAALFPHMNACTLERFQEKWTPVFRSEPRQNEKADRRLLCAASNFPKVPMTSAIEIFDPLKMTHLSTISLGEGIGSLTWISRQGGFWWAGFANYDGRGGEPGRDHRYTAIIKFDDQWRRVSGYLLPDAVLERMKPMSTSGGAWGDDGLLYVTGHDRPEVYALRLPKAGSTLELVATLPIPFEGQAIDWDPKQKRLLWGISRKDRKAIAVAIPTVDIPAR
jgi:hypothetical protein